MNNKIKICEVDNIYDSEISCSICVKNDVCGHRIKIIHSFIEILENKYGPYNPDITEELKMLVAKHCKYGIFKIKKEQNNG